MEINYQDIKVIGFDADDTLWVNETYFREAEEEFCNLMAEYETPNKTDQELFKMEMKNLPLYGYGVKAFALSMVEMALEISNHNVSQKTIHDILNIGKNMLEKPVELLDGVEEVLKHLSKKYRLILATKGDLLDQERKLEKSGLTEYFHHIEVMSDKHEANYKQLIQHLDIRPEEFVMIGNSLRSDILPVKKIGAHAIYIPYDLTWQHETVDAHDLHKIEFDTVSEISEVINLL